MNLDERVGIVTGASTGIGRATAVALAQEGCRVVLSARREEKLRQVAGDIEEAGGDTAVVSFDLQDEASIERLVEIVEEEHGRLDILVNNAGVGDWQFDGLDSSTIRTITEVNLLGLQQLTFAALPLLRASAAGHIVNISSMAGRGSSGDHPIYNSAKAGVNTFSASLTRRFREDPLRVTLVEPGAVDTPIQSDDLRGSEWILQPEEIADAIVYAVTRPRRASVHNISVIPASPAGEE